MEFLSLKPESFGLDISDLSLKIVKLKKNGGFLTLASFGETEIKPGIIEEGEVKDEEKLADIIKGALLKVKGEKLRTKWVIVSLPEEKAFLQVIQLPIMEERDLRSAVLFEAENYVPMPIEEVYLGFQVVSPVCNHLDHLDVLLAAQPKKIVDGYLKSIKKAGLLAKVFEIESQAIARALIKNEFGSLPVLLIDIGATRTSLIVFSGHSMRFTTSVQISSQKFTEAISKTLKLSMDEAENLKIKYGVGIEKEGQAVFEALTPVLNDLIHQIKKYLDYYQGHSGNEHLQSSEGKEIAGVILCGGGANIKGLPEFMSKELKIQAELGNPWINILPKPLKKVPELSFEKSLSYTTALGLALRGIREN